MPTPKRIVQFYQSKQWKRVRNYKRALERGICESCGKAGWEVHHVIPLTLENLDDPNISISLENLQLLCTSCHNAKRAKEKELREDVEFNEIGDLVKSKK
jgi:5-methylcytosine-specific restriction enzyme A